MLQCSFVLMFHNMCYTENKMQSESSPTGRRSWSKWAHFLHCYGMESLAAWVLEASGPLAVVGAQMLYLGSPILRPLVRAEQVDSLASLLEDHEELLAFTEFLREGKAG
jgi:hypothetical protein